MNISQYTAEKVKPDNFWSTSLLVFQCSPISLTPALYCHVHPITWTYTVRGNAKDKEAKTLEKSCRTNRKRQEQQIHQGQIILTWWIILNAVHIYSYYFSLGISDHLNNFGFIFLKSTFFNFNLGLWFKFSEISNLPHKVSGRFSSPTLPFARLLGIDFN